MAAKNAAQARLSAPGKLLEMRACSPSGQSRRHRLPDAGIRAFFRSDISVRRRRAEPVSWLRGRARRGSALKNSASCLRSCRLFLELAHQRGAFVERVQDRWPSRPLAVVDCEMHQRGRAQVTAEPDRDEF